MKLHFGFSYVGLIFLFMLMLPNAIWVRHKPQDYEKYAKRENKTLLAFERIGQVLVSSLVLIFRDFNIGKITLHSAFLFAAFLLMLLMRLGGFVIFAEKRRCKAFIKAYSASPSPAPFCPLPHFSCLAFTGKIRFSSCPLLSSESGISEFTYSIKKKLRGNFRFFMGEYHIWEEKKY